MKNKHAWVSEFTTGKKKNQALLWTLSSASAPLEDTKALVSDLWLQTQAYNQKITMSAISRFQTCSLKQIRSYEHLMRRYKEHTSRYCHHQWLQENKLVAHREATPGGTASFNHPRIRNWNPGRAQQDATQGKWLKITLTPSCLQNRAGECRTNTVITDVTQSYLYIQ